jgi:hypothetical protein
MVMHKPDCDRLITIGYMTALDAEQYVRGGQDDREGWQMIRRSTQALAAVAACLALCACGASSAPTAGGSSGSPSAGPGTSTASTGTIVGTSHFCRKASSFMGKIPPAPTGHVSLTQARANMTTVLRTTVRGFSGLRAQAPHSLRRPLKKIIAAYRADERSVRRAGSVKQFSAAMVKHNVTAAADFERVLKYIAANCR